MYRRLRKTACAAARRACGLLLFGAASARADDVRREKESARDELSSRASTRRGHRDHAQQTARSHETARTDARGGRAAQIKRARGRCCKRRSLA